MSTTEVSVGISIGGDCCVVAMHSTAAAGRFDVAANDAGDRTTPAVVSFADGETLVGAPAKALKVRQPMHTVSNVVQLLAPAVVQEGRVRLTCEAEVVDTDGELVVQLPSADPDGPRDAPNVFRALLQGLRAVVVDGALAGTTPRAVVLAVPRYVDHDVVSKCAETVGLGAGRLRVIASDVAAYLALKHKQSGALWGPSRDAPPHLALLVDWGGTSCTATVLHVAGGSLGVLASDTDFSVGGAVLDREIVKMLAQTFQKKTRLDPSDNGRAMRKLLAVAEQTKHALTAAGSANVEVEALCEGLDLRDTVSRMKFEAAVRDTGVLSKVGTLVETVVTRALEGAVAGLRISDVGLTGGTCRIPIVATSLRASIPALPTVAPHLAPEGVSNLSDVPGDEAAAVGAAIQATLLASTSTDALEDGNGSASAPSLARSLALVVVPQAAGAAPGAAVPAADVVFLLRAGALVPATVAMQLPPTETHTALQFAIATSPDDSAFFPLGAPVVIDSPPTGAPEAERLVALCVSATRHQGLRLQLHRAARVTDGAFRGAALAGDPIPGAQRMVELS